MSKNKKYYVVWKGKKPGIYKSWEECKAMISGYKNPQYRAFPTKAQAQEAFESNYWTYIGKKTTHRSNVEELANSGKISLNSIAVDAASSGNPGIMEYRGVDTKTQKVLFHMGPFPLGTNNIGEFLALVHGLAFLHQRKSNRIIYSDSQIAIGWVRKKKCKTTLAVNPKTAKLHDLIKRAETWLKSTDYKTRIIKWDTSSWGEIPADFGRK
ncbi:MAG TPA: ribonuclease H family protein [Flavobacteriaceae bacterium]|nr:ribonuclease H family protein [Flavobacteriaceae bacterium]